MSDTKNNFHAPWHGWFNIVLFLYVVCGGMGPVHGKESSDDKMSDRYVASMLLSGVGDALAYKGGSWEFSKSGPSIHQEVADLGGLAKIKVKLPDFPVSDDTVLHLATGEALVKSSGQEDKEKLYLQLATKYKEGMRDMEGRAPGLTTMSAVAQLKPLRPQGYQIPFNARGGGCGAAMRAMCIGLRYHRPEDLDDLIAVSVEAGRMSHHHPTGYLGGLASALFVSYAIQGKPPKEWGAGLLATLPKAKEYVISQGRYVEENTASWSYFEEKWQTYLKFRGIEDGISEPQFTADDESVEKRDALYKSWSFSGWGGASGHDAPMIAYDAFLGSGNSWKELCDRGMFHSGDSDSTGVIAGALFGASYGLEDVPPNNYKNLEYKDRLENVGRKLYKMSHDEEDILQENANGGATTAKVQ